MSAEVTSEYVPLVAEVPAARARKWRRPARMESARRGDRYSIEDVSARAAGATAAAALLVMIAASVVLVSIADRGASWLSPIATRVDALPSWAAGPLGPLTAGFKVDATNIDISVGVLVGAMFVAYLVVLLLARRLSPPWVLAAVVVLHVVFFLAPPMQLTDIFNYVNYARMEVLHGLNPYTTIPALGPTSDPTFGLSNWHGLLNPYGPLFTLLTCALVPLGLVASFWALKAVLMLLSLGIVWLMWHCAEFVGRDRLTSALFVGLNPIVLVWGLGADHNDFVMVFPIVLAMYLLLSATSARVGSDGPRPADATVNSPVRDPVRASVLGRRAYAWLDGTPRPLSRREPGPARELGAGMAIAAAIAIKASAGILAPVVILGATRRTRLSLGLLLGLLAAAAVTILAFGVNLPDLVQQDSLVVQNGVPNLLGYLAGAGGESSGLHRLLELILAVGVAGCALWAARTRDWITACGGAALLTLLTLSWMLPSYVLWVLPFAALAPRRWLRVSTILFAVYVFVFWMPYTPRLEQALHLDLGATNLGQAESNLQNSLEF